MLISKEVEVELSGTNIEYFENKGYFIPRRVDKQGRTNVKRGTKIIVKVEDLKDNSDVLVSVQCDDNGEILENVEWKVYKYHVKEDGKYYYKPHNNSSRKISKKYLGRGLSFYDWCYKYLPKYMADYILSRWDYEKNIDKEGNIISPKNVGHGSDGFDKKKRGYWFKCLDHPEHGSELKSICRFTNNFKGFMGSIECIQCNVVALTHPHLVKYFAIKEDAYKYSFGSSEIVLMKCPDCGCEREIRVSDLSNKGFSCRICSDKIPYTEKFFANFLKQILQENYIMQLSTKTFKWCDRYQYDFYIDKMNGIICEIMGNQHYEENHGNWKMSLDEIQINDFDKEWLARINKVKNYIIIDCRKSEMKWIKRSIMQSRLPKLLNFKESDIDWLECHEAGCKNMIKEVCDLYNDTRNVLKISELFKIGTQTVGKYLKQGAELGWCDYNSKTRVVCVTTGEVFESQTEAGKKYNTTGISKCCSDNDIRRTAGKLLDGTKLIWMFYEEYIMKTKDEIENILKEELEEPHGMVIKVICLTNGEIFSTMTSAAEEYNISYNSISSCCRKSSFSAGTDLITGKPLVWMYYDEYVLKTKDEIQSILNNKRIKTRFKGEIICLTTRETFNDVYEAGIKYNIRADAISFCCDKDKTNKSAGKLSDGTKMVWMYYKDYILKTKDEIEEILLPSNFVKVICLTTGEIFHSLAEAQRKYKNASHIGHCCKGKAKSSGSLLDGVRLTWMYYDEYLESNK